MISHAPTLHAIANALDLPHMKLTIQTRALIYWAIESADPFPNYDTWIMVRSLRVTNPTPQNPNGLTLWHLLALDGFSVKEHPNGARILQAIVNGQENIERRAVA